MAWTIYPNVTSPQTGTVVLDMLYKIITIFLSAWGAGAVKSSGDGQALYSSSGNVFTQGVGSPLTAGSIGNTNAWFVVGAPDSSFFICYQRTGTFNNNWNAVFSRNPFTGGNATTRATSSGEIAITTGSGASSVLSSSSPSYVGGVQHGIFGDASEEYAFAIFNYSCGFGGSGSNQIGGLFLDVCERSFANAHHASRFVFCAYQGTTSIGAAPGLMHLATNQIRTPDINGFAQAEPDVAEGALVSVALVGGASGGGAYSHEYGRGWDGEVELFRPVWTMVGATFGKSVIKGASRLFRVTSVPNSGTAAIQNGRCGPLSLSSNKQWLFLGDEGSIAVPWDGTSDPVSAA